MLDNPKDLYYSLFNNSNDAIVLHDFKGNLLDVNKQFLNLFGYSKEEVLKLKLKDFHPKEEISTFEKQLKNVSKTGSNRFDINLLKKNGESFPCEVSASTITVGDNNYIQGIIRDISFRVHTLDVLAETDKKKSFILDAITEHIVLQDKEHNIIWVNKAGVNSVSLEPQQLEGKKCYQVWLKFDDECEGCPVSSAIETKALQTKEMTTPDGRSWVIKGYPVFDTLNEVIGAVELTNETTELRKIEKLLLDSEEKYRVIAGASTDLISILNENFEHEYHNKDTTFNLLGFDPLESKEARSYMAIIHEEDIHSTQKVMLQAFKEGIQNHQLRIRHKNGNYLWLETNGYVYTDTKGNKKLLLISRDITHIKNVEQNLRSLYGNMQFYKDLIAHDMNNILHIINNSVQLTELHAKQIGGLPPKYKELVSIVKEQVDRGKLLIDNVRRFSKVGENGIGNKKIDALKVVRKAINSTKSLVKNSHTKINLSSEIKSGFVYSSDFLLDVFENVIINGVKHNKKVKGKEIAINISKIKKNKQNFLRFKFQDNGIGVPDEDKEKIFLGKPKLLTNKDGMGIGLSLSKKIVENSKGTIKLENRVKNDYSKGSIFIIDLPEFQK